MNHFNKDQESKDSNDTEKVAFSDLAIMMSQQ